MMKDLWTMFCGDSDCFNIDATPCPSFIESFIHPSSCTNHAMIICFNSLLLAIFLSSVVQKSTSKASLNGNHYDCLSTLQIVSAVINGCLGLLYIGLGIFILQDKLRNIQCKLPSHWWLPAFFQGITLLVVGITVSLKQRYLPKFILRILSIFAFLFAGILCFITIIAAVVENEASLKTVLDVFSFLGASLLLRCTYKCSKYEHNEGILYAPLYDGTNSSTNTADSICCVTPFSKAGFLSRMSFSWLNPLMVMGSEKTLEDENIPKLGEMEEAKSCYLVFEEQLNRQRQSDPSSQPSILKTLILCHWYEISVSGFFAFLKILCLSTGPLLLNAFIRVAEGKQDFKYEGYVLAVSLFFTKCLESLAQRQWYFRSRLIGMKLRSLLTAAIYSKQLRLSNASKLVHSGGEIMNYLTVDAYRIGEFPFWFHQTWTTTLQLCIALIILFSAVGLATIAALVVIVVTVLFNMPLAKLQHKFQSKLMVAQDERLKATSEALLSMKVLKLYAWETHFKGVIEGLRKVEHKWLSAVQLRKGYNSFLFWSSPVLVSTATFGACYFLGISLYASNVFTFLATLRLLQEPIRAIPDVIAVVIQAKVSFARIVKFLEAPELQSGNIHCKCDTVEDMRHSILIKSANFSWEDFFLKHSLRNINLEIRTGEKVAICGEVGSGKSTLLAAVLGEVPNVQGTIDVYGKIAYVSQTAWIQTGTIQENIIFGSTLDPKRYQETLQRCSLVKDLELLPYGDHTEIGERGVNLSGGQKQRIQLARALYRDADIYLLDDPFSAVDAQTASSLFNEYVMDALSGKAVLLVTHQVDFLPAFDNVLLMSDGEIIKAAPYHLLLASSPEFQNLVHAHKETAGSERPEGVKRHEVTAKDITKISPMRAYKPPKGDQLIKQEEKETGNTGFTTYLQYLNQSKGFLYFSLATLSHIFFVIGQILQNTWMASKVGNPSVSMLRLIVVYLSIGFICTFFLLARSLLTVVLGLQSSKALFSRLLNSLFGAPMSFYDSTPLGRILSRVSSDLSIVDLDVPFALIFAVGATTNAYSNLGVLAIVTWQVLFVSIPMVYLAIRLQRYYFSTAKELMRINGTTKSSVANHLSESVAGSMTIRAFGEQDRFFCKCLSLVDRNATPFFHNFAANEWLIQRLETLSATVLSSSALCMVLLPPGTFGPGFIGMALSYGLSLNMSLVMSIQNQCTLANFIISVERINQYTNIPSESPVVIEENRPPHDWPSKGRVEIQDLQIRYRPNTPLVLQGINCTIEGGQKIGIVGRTGSGKTTLIGALFRLVEPVGGKIVVDGIDISELGLHDLRSRFSIIPQDPTLFNGTVRYNLDPLSRHSDPQIWEVLGKCQLGEGVREKEGGLDSSVAEDGSNWSMGQRQLFCLGRALLRRSRVLVLDEATASIDNSTDFIIQRTIRSEFEDCTVITVAHRIPTVMNSSMVLVISDGKLMEYDEPARLMKREGSVFGELVNEYWSHSRPSHQIL